MNNTVNGREGREDWTMTEWNARQTTLHDVARESGFSKSVVSRALLNQSGVRTETAELIRAVAKRMNYTPNPLARALIGARTTTIGLILRNPALAFYAELADAIHAHATDADYRVISISHDRRENTYDAAIRHLVQLQVDGLVVSSSLVEPSAIEAISKEVPTVVVGRGQLDSPSVSSVSLAPDASKALVEVLAAKGHTHIGLLHHSRESSPTQYERNELTVGFVRELGLQVTRVVVDETDRTVSFDEMLGSGASVVLCAGDPTALDLMQRARERGVGIPDEIEVVGFDGVGSFSHPWIGLSSYRVPVSQMAGECMRIVLEQIKDASRPAEHVQLYGSLHSSRSADLSTGTGTATIGGAA